MTSPPDPHGTPRRSREFRVTAAERDAFVGKVLLLLDRRGFVARAECASRPPVSRVHLFARHPYGAEHGVTITIQSADWAISLSGTPITPSDVVDRLVKACRRRTP